MEETQRADAAESALQKLQEKVLVVEQERDRLVNERNSLREIKAELQANAAARAEFEEDKSKIEAMPLADVGTSLGTIENIVSKQHLQDSTLLKSISDEGSSKELVFLRNQINEYRKVKEDLEIELRLSHRRVLTLENKLKECREHQLAVCSRQPSYEGMQEMQNKADRFNQELDCTNSQLEVALNEISVKNNMIKALEENVILKEEELTEKTANFNAYLEKARQVILALKKIKESPQDISEPNTAKETMKKQLHEKEQALKDMEENFKRMQIMKDQETQLVASAFHEMALEMHRTACRERLRGLSVDGTPSCFFSRQRELRSSLTLPDTQNWLPHMNSDSPMPSSSLMGKIYRGVVRRNFVFFAICVAGAFGIEIVIDRGGDKIYDYCNRGKQWKDVRAALEIAQATTNA
ncbi:unnamed protein product [Soboliphyme baturini]|uniref:Cytochrome b-c1 complex subunit 9 n=1 Tax=Soboliphyme baturini TaxID=241478 RepID=A0A183IZR6_9BILA|nr:unnamed protein product [Soboliphyme baturini]